MKLIERAGSVQARGRCARARAAPKGKPGEAFFNTFARRQLRRAVLQQNFGAVPVIVLWQGGARPRLIVFALIACFSSAATFAQFAAAPPQGVPPAPPPDGIAGWLIAKQAEFYRLLSGTIRAAKTDGSAVWLLMGISFAYGVFHAAGPGHGKAVISSYLVANEETWKRGITLSFASALLQALVAVAVVGIAAALLGATAGTMSRAVWWIEIVSYALIARWARGSSRQRAGHS